MSGFIILNDGRAWTASDRAFDAIMEALAETILDSGTGNALASWLLDQRSLLKGPGMGSVDLRELTPANQERLLATIEFVCNVPKLTENLSAWSDKVHLLVRMVEAFKQGEPPMLLNPDMKDLVPPTRRRAGPGWENSI